MTLLSFIAGLVALVLGAELLVRGASKMALSFGVSPLVIGLTVVSFGTSAPELATSIAAVLGGTTDLAMGNVVGSNIFNVLCVLGLPALIAPMAVNIQLIRQEVPVMIGASLLLLVLTLDGRLGLVDSALLTALMVGYTVFLVRQSRREIDPALAPASRVSKAAPSAGRHHRVVTQLALIVIGMGLLVLGSGWLVSSAVVFAKALDVSDVVIGLTIVAAGTSVPEVATSLMAAIKGERDIAVGNVVGSCIFNILGCLGVSGLVAGSQGLLVPEGLLHFDLWIMVATALACLPVFISGREIARWEGAVFVLYYAAYMMYLILASQQHQALARFSSVMLGFVLPLTLFTLVVSVFRRSVR